MSCTYTCLLRTVERVVWLGSQGGRSALPVVGRLDLCRGARGACMAAGIGLVGIACLGAIVVFMGLGARAQGSERYVIPIQETEPGTETHDRTGPDVPRKSSSCSAVNPIKCGRARTERSRSRRTTGIGWGRVDARCRFEMGAELDGGCTFVTLTVNNKLFISTQ